VSAHPWLEPLHRRVGITLLCAGWVGFELWQGTGSLWLWLALGALGYALWDFFLSGNYRAG
jgi:hypothetical protein